jgi:rare lipoprotein A (peptidoglycan hydrolase)
MTIRTLTAPLALLAAMVSAGALAPDALAEGPAPSGGTAAPALGSASAPGTSTIAPVAPVPAGRRIRPSGIATWFGPGFYGRRTACGQTLTPEVVGVANRTLPCGTLVKVTYAGRSLVVPVLDRGPYGRFGADWDLTAGAAAALGITETVRINTRLIGSTINSPTLGLPDLPQTATLAGGALAS